MVSTPQRVLEFLQIILQYLIWTLSQLTKLFTFFTYWLICMKMICENENDAF